MCEHKNTTKGLTDVVVHSHNSILIMDVPCVICEQCHEIIRIKGDLLEIAISIATNKGDGTVEKFRMEYRESSEKKRKQWTGLVGTCSQESKTAIDVGEKLQQVTTDLTNQPVEVVGLPLGSRCSLVAHRPLSQPPMLHFVEREIESKFSDVWPTYVIECLKCPVCGVLHESTDRRSDIRDVLEPQLVGFENPPLMDKPVCLHCGLASFSIFRTRLSTDGLVEQHPDVELRKEHRNKTWDHRDVYRFCDFCLHVDRVVIRKADNPQHDEQWMQELILPVTMGHLTRNQ